jgi:TRAP-type C4-dicarboxylate transport system permease small subunit
MTGIPRLLGAALAAVPLAMVAVTCLDVVGRRFNAPLPGAIEIIELLMGVLVFGALPLVTADRGHVTVGLFDERLGERLRALRDRVIGLLSAAVVAVIAWRLFAKALETASFGDRSAYLGVPLAPLGFFMAAMAAASVAVLLLHALRPAPAQAAAP